MNTDIRVIFVDLGGTFRVIRDDLEYKTAAKARIAELLGAPGDPTEFFDTVIDKRYDVYREWCLRFMCEAPEEMLWTRWLAYDFPKDRVKAAAKELTYAYRRTKGERVVVEKGVETVRELRRRGYTVGIISDLVGKGEVDEWLDHDGIRDLFDTVQQSSITYIRKPNPAIYFYAMEELGVEAENCCYVGDNLNRDIVGAKAAGCGLTVAVEYEDMPPLKVTEENRPDAKVIRFEQLLDIFPARGEVASDRLIAPVPRGK